MLESSRKLLTLAIQSVTLRPAPLVSRNAKSQTHPDPLDQNLHFRKIPGNLYTLKFKMCCTISYQRPGPSSGDSDLFGLGRNLGIIK